MSSRTIALVACSAGKLATAAPARDLYTGHTFKLARAWAERFADAWFILSALHGVVEPGQVLEPYDATLPERDTEVGVVEVLPGRTRATRHWPLNTYCNRCKSHAVPRWLASAGVTLVGLAPRRYLTPFRCKRFDLVAPLDGLGIGAQKGWLASQLRVGTQLDLLAEATHA